MKRNRIWYCAAFIFALLLPLRSLAEGYLYVYVPTPTPYVDMTWILHPERRSVFNTGSSDEELAGLGAGLFRAGEHFNKGVYTFTPETGCADTLKIYNAEKKLIHEYDTIGGEQFTLYLDDGMYAEIPAHCPMTCVKYDLLFQDGKDPYTIRHAKYFTGYQIATITYFLTGLDNDAYFTFYNMDAERGIGHPVKVSLKKGEVMKLKITREQCNMFVEFYHCQIVMDRSGEG